MWGHSFRLIIKKESFGKFTTICNENQIFLETIENFFNFVTIASKSIPDSFCQSRHRQKRTHCFSTFIKGVGWPIDWQSNKQVGFFFKLELHVFWLSCTNSDIHIHICMHLRCQSLILTYLLYSDMQSEQNCILLIVFT